MSPHRLGGRLAGVTPARCPTPTTSTSASPGNGGAGTTSYWRGNHGGPPLAAVAGPTTSTTTPPAHHALTTARPHGHGALSKAAVGGTYDAPVSGVTLTATAGLT